MARQDDSITTIFFALSANALIAVTKGIAAWVTGSTAMVAEAVHSVADCSERGLMEVGYERYQESRRVRVNTERPAGVPRATMAALMLAVFTVSVGESRRRLRRALPDRGTIMKESPLRKAVFAATQTPAVSRRRFASSVLIQKLFCPVL